LCSVPVPTWDYGAAFPDSMASHPGWPPVNLGVLLRKRTLQQCSHPARVICGKLLENCRIPSSGRDKSDLCGNYLHCLKPKRRRNRISTVGRQQREQTRVRYPDQNQIHPSVHVFVIFIYELPSANETHELRATLATKVTKVTYNDTSSRRLRLRMHELHITASEAVHYIYEFLRLA
jgi:hypothetical protein